jgi:hypothetical protein
MQLNMHYLYSHAYTNSFTINFSKKSKQVCSKFSMATRVKIPNLTVIGLCVRKRYGLCRIEVGLL